MLGRKQMDFLRRLGKWECKTINFSDADERALLFDMFGGEERMHKEFPQIYQLTEKTAAQHKKGFRRQTADGGGELEKGGFFAHAFVDFQKERGTIRISGEAMLKDRAAFMLQVTTLYDGAEKIAEVRNASAERGFYIETEGELRLDFDRLADPFVSVETLWCGESADTMQLCIQASAAQTRGFVQKIERTAPVVTKKHEEKGILVVYGRQDYQDKGKCDYYYPLSSSTDRQKLQIKISGNVFGIGSNVTYDKSASRIWLEDKYKQMYFYSPQSNPGITSVVSGTGVPGFCFSFPLDWNTQFEKNSKLYGTQFYLKANMEFRGQDGSGTLISYISQDNPSPYFGGEAMDIEVITMLWGCVAKDTRVEEKTKGTIRVCEAEIGDWIKVSPQGGYAEIKNIWVGREEHIWNIETESGALVRVSETHPIMTEEGWRPACRLRGHSRILLADGSWSGLAGVWTETYGDQVYNLEMEGAEGFFGDGILVGDFKQQNASERQAELQEVRIPLKPELKKECIKFAHL